MTASRIYRLVPLIVIALAAAAGLAGAVRPAAAAPGPPDLEVSVTASPNPVITNGTDPTITYTLKVYNTPVERCELYRGEDRCISYGRSVSGVVIDLAGPAGSTYRSAVTDHGFSCAAQSAALVRCLNGGLSMYDEATITIKLRAPNTSGKVTATATVDPANAIAERSETNNSASATVTAALLTDMAVTGFTASPNPVYRYSTVTFTVTVSNVSNIAANGVLIALYNDPATSMPLHFVTGGNADGWSCRQEPGDPSFTVICGKGSNLSPAGVPAGGSVTLTITATTEGPQSIALVASVSVNWGHGSYDAYRPNDDRFLALAVQ